MVYAVSRNRRHARVEWGHEVESADRGRLPVAEDAQSPTTSSYVAQARVPGKKGRDL